MLASQHGVAHDLGAALAAEVAKRLILYAGRPDYQSQLSPVLEAQVDGEQDPPREHVGVGLLPRIVRQGLLLVIADRSEDHQVGLLLVAHELQAGLVQELVDHALGELLGELELPRLVLEGRDVDRVEVGRYGGAERVAAGGRRDQDRGHRRS